MTQTVVRHQRMGKAIKMYAALPCMYEDVNTTLLYLSVISGFRRDVDECALFRDITQRRVAVLYRRFGTTYQSHLKGSRSPRRKGTSWPLKMGLINCPETSLQNYHSPLRNILEERESHLHRGGSLTSRSLIFVAVFLS
jgi:hypothetical protein